MNVWIKYLLLAYTMSAVVCFGHAHKYFNSNCEAGMYENRFSGCSVGEKAMMVSLVWPFYISHTLWNK